MNRSVEVITETSHLFSQTLLEQRINSSSHIRSWTDLTALIKKIEPAVDAVEKPLEAELRNSSNLEFVDAVSKKNVEMTLVNIRQRSEIIKEMEDNAEIKIIGAMYDIATGVVEFYD